MNRSRILIVVAVIGLSFVFVSVVSADTTYVVRYGDTLWRIARFYGTTPAAIQNANPKITNINLIYAGEVLVIPGNIGTGGQGNYIIQYGDTLFGIARRHGTTVAAIRAINPQIVNPNRIYAGHRLAIPAATNPNIGVGTANSDGEPVAIPSDNVHIVQPGDGLMSIARRYGTTVEVLLSLNTYIENPDLILVGDKIVLPGG